MIKGFELLGVCLNFESVQRFNFILSNYFLELVQYEDHNSNKILIQKLRICIHSITVLVYLDTNMRCKLQPEEDAATVA